MPSPQGRPVSPIRGGARGRDGAASRPTGSGDWAARAAESPTSPARASHTRQRLGKVAVGRRRRPPWVTLALTPRPKGWPQRAQTMRPAMDRSAFTAQLPQLGQAMNLPHLLGTWPMVAFFPGAARHRSPPSSRDSTGVLFVGLRRGHGKVLGGIGVWGAARGRGCWEIP